MFYHPKTLEPYLVNSSLSLKNLADLENSSEVVAFYEASPAADGTIGVVYADGYYQRIPSEDWAAVTRSLALKARACE